MHVTFDLYWLQQSWLNRLREQMTVLGESSSPVQWIVTPLLAGAWVFEWHDDHPLTRKEKKMNFLGGISRKAPKASCTKETMTPATLTTSLMLKAHLIASADFTLQPVTALLVGQALTEKNSFLLYSHLVPTSVDSIASFDSYLMLTPIITFKRRNLLLQWLKWSMTANRKTNPHSFFFFFFSHLHTATKVIFLHNYFKKA